MGWLAYILRYQPGLEKVVLWARVAMKITEVGKTDLMALVLSRQIMERYVHW